MKRTFADLHLRLDLNDAASAQQVLTKAASLGYGLVSVPLTPQTQGEEIIKLKKLCNDLKIDVTSRVDIAPKTRGQLMHMLRKLRRRFEVIAVVCENKEVARQAAKDRRVDLLNFLSNDYRQRFFDWAEAELASNSLAALEVDLKPLLLLEGSARIKLLATLRREISIAREYSVPVVFSSGADNELLLRKPREAAALVSLLGLDEATALAMLSSNPSEIVARNRKKLGHGFVAPGIHAIREGRDP
jgi:RNase P/RNase MRP subunit p30